MIKSRGPDNKEKILKFPINEKAEPRLEDMLALLLKKAEDDREREEQIKAEKEKYEKLKAQGKIDI